MLPPLRPARGRLVNPRAVPYVVLAAVAALYLFPFVRVLSGTLDEGVFLYGAQAVTRGAVPFRDFMEPQGPASFYWLAGFFELFGASFLTARALLLATGVATVLLIFYLARRVERLGLFAALFVLVTSIPPMAINSPHYDSNLFGLIAFALFLLALDRLFAEPRRTSGPLLFLSGMMAGVTTTFIQQKGGLLIASFVLALLLLHRKKAVRLCGLVCTGYSLVLVVELSGYAVARAIPSLIEANFIWPLTTYTSMNSSPYGYALFERLWPAWLAGLRLSSPLPVAYGLASALSVPYLFAMSVPVLLVVMGWLLRKEAFTRTLLPYWLTGYALFFSELQRADIGHLRNGCIILVVLFFALCERSRYSFFKPLALGIIACTVFNGMANAGSAVSARVPILSRNGTLYSHEKDDALDFLVRHTQRGDNVFVYPYRPIYYFLADVHNPTRFSYLLYHFNTDEQIRGVVRDLERQNSRYVLWDTSFAGSKITSEFPAYRHPPPSELIVEPYLESHYRQIGLASGFRIMERIE